MRDDEILRDVGLGELLDNMDHMFTRGRVLKAMAEARGDERVQAASDLQIAIMCEDFPVICEDAADFIVTGKVGPHAKDQS
jgi:hypothetical protein